MANVNPMPIAAATAAAPAVPTQTQQPQISQDQLTRILKSTENSILEKQAMQQQLKEMQRKLDTLTSTNQALESFKKGFEENPERFIHEAISQKNIPIEKIAQRFLNSEQAGNNDTLRAILARLDGLEQTYNGKLEKITTQTEEQRYVYDIERILSNDKYKAPVEAYKKFVAAGFGRAPTVEDWAHYIVTQRQAGVEMTPEMFANELLEEATRAVGAVKQEFGIVTPAVEPVKEIPVATTTAASPKIDTLTNAMDSAALPVSTFKDLPHEQRKRAVEQYLKGRQNDDDAAGKKYIEELKAKAEAKLAPKIDPVAAPPAIVPEIVEHIAE
jgi:hypothetical protein